MHSGNCWNEIGVRGDRSCERLEEVSHCQLCPVYTTAGRHLLDREVPPDYLQEWANTLAQPLESQSTLTPAQPDALEIGQAGKTLSTMIFRLGSERFALPVRVLQEVTRPAPIHPLPHRTSDVFLGLVNIRGEILPCVSLGQFLQVETPIDPTYSRMNLRRMLVIGNPDTRWVFPVDEVYRVYRFHPDELFDPPVVVTRASQSYTQNILYWFDTRVNYLDADRLLQTLDRRLL